MTPLECVWGGPQKPRLAQQLVELAVLFVGDLDRELLVDPGVADEVDGAEASASQRLQNLVLAELLAEQEHVARGVTITRSSAGAGGNVEDIDNTRVFA